MNKKTMAITRGEMTRDGVCVALADLYGYSPFDFDGMTLPEITQSLEMRQLNEVCDYLEIA
jgi:hypothetical protein